MTEKGLPQIQTGRLVDQMRGGGEDSELCFCLVLSGYKLWYDERLKFDHFIFLNDFEAAAYGASVLE